MRNDSGDVETRYKEQYFIVLTMGFVSTIPIAGSFFLGILVYAQNATKPVFARLFLSALLGILHLGAYWSLSSLWKH